MTDLLYYNMLAGSMVIVYASLYWRRGKYMRQEDTELIAEQFTDVVEELVLNEDIDRSTATEIYVRLKRVFPTTRNLYPSPSWLKDRIEKRRTYHIHDPVPLPSDTPVQRKRRHAFEKL